MLETVNLANAEIDEIEGFFKAIEKPSPTEETNELNEKSIKIRWKHPELFDVGYVAVPSHFLELYSYLKPALTSGEALFVIQLMNFKWTEKEPFPSYKVLAQRMGVTDKAVRRYAAALEAKKYLVRNERKGRTNTFDLSKLFDALAEMRFKIGRRPIKKKGDKKQ